MAGSTEFRNEQFIQQYEHIIKLQLLTDEELTHVKRKRSLFEVQIKNASEMKPFIDYIKFEVALLKKFKQIDYENENDEKALDKVMSAQVKDLFRLALKKFQDKRKLWAHYISFAKYKFPTIVTSIYQEMLHFHHNSEDFIEAAEHTMKWKNYELAQAILVQGIGNHRECSEKFVVIYIECSLKQGVHQDDKEKAATLLQASKFYDKFLKPCDDILIHCDLMGKIQCFDYAISFQNDILTHMMKTFTDRAELWNLVAKRHLDGLFYEAPNEGEDNVEAVDGAKIIEKVSFDICLRRAIETYEKSLESVADSNKQKMFSFFINRLLELDEKRDLSAANLRIIRRSLGQTLLRGVKEEKLSEAHFIFLLKLRLIDMQQNKVEIDQMLEKSHELYPNSMELYEITIKYLLTTEDYNKISKTFQHVADNNPTNVITVYRFLCSIYLKNPEDIAAIDRAEHFMLEAIKSSNKELSEAFQPSYIELLTLRQGIESSRKAFNHMIGARTMNSLSLEFFKMMVKIEKQQEKPDEKIIRNCYERAVEHFGKENSEIWLDYIQHLWKLGKHSEADELRKRAMIVLKDNLKNVDEFEMKFTVLRNTAGMEVDVV